MAWFCFKIPVSAAIWLHFTLQFLLFFLFFGRRCVFIVRKFGRKVLLDGFTKNEHENQQSEHTVLFYGIYALVPIIRRLVWWIGAKWNIVTLEEKPGFQKKSRRPKLQVEIFIFWQLHNNFSFDRKSVTGFNQFHLKKSTFCKNCDESARNSMDFGVILSVKFDSLAWFYSVAAQTWTGVTHKKHEVSSGFLQMQTFALCQMDLI